MSKRTTITNGIRLFRYLFIPPIFIFLSQTFTSPETWQRELFFFLLFSIIFFLIYKSRRVRFDDQNIYRIYGKTEKAVPFTSIVSIIRSGRKINNRRMWRLNYLDKDQLEHRFHFLEGTFQHGSVNELIKKVTEANPDVKIERSHFWDQVNRSLGKS